MKRVTPLYSAVVLILFASVAAVVADEVVKLKDGSLVEGTILSEDDQQINMEVRLAGGTMFIKKSYPKSDVVEIKRLTAEQIKERDAEVDYQKASKYQLNATTSFQLDYYDKVISAVFDQFLTQYPGSRHTNEVAGWKAQWQSERDQVASGKMKLRGQWVSGSEAAQLINQARAVQRLQQARVDLTAGSVEQAIAGCRAAVSNCPEPEIVTQASTLQDEAYAKWIESLDRRRKEVAIQIQSSQESAAHDKTTTQTGALSLKSSGRKKMIGPDSSAVSQQAAQVRAKANQEQLAQLQEDLHALEEQITAVKSRAMDARTALAAVSDPSKPPTSGMGTGEVASATSDEKAAASASANSSSPASNSRNQLYTFGIILACVAGLWFLFSAFRKKPRDDES